MEKPINNKIIAISGEPVSGKGTTVKAIISKLEKQGYQNENIHLVSTGEEFRKFFNSIIDFIKNLNQPEALKKIGKSSQLQQILKNKEYRDVLKETIAKIQNSSIDLTNFSIANANSRPELSEIRKIVDTIIDGNIKQLGEKINEKNRENEIWLIDSRLAFYNIPSAFSVRLTTNSDIAGQRLFNDKTRGKEDIYKTVEEATKEREKRRLDEISRYKKRYNIDLENIENYDLIIDTSYLNVQSIAEIIINCERKYINNEGFPKKWQGINPQEQTR